MTQLTIFCWILLLPLVGATASLILSPYLSFRVARLSAAVSLAMIVQVWWSGTSLPAPELEISFPWLPNHATSVFLTLTPFSLLFLFFSQLVSCGALWQKGEARDNWDVSALQASQLALNILFTAQDWFAFCVAWQAFWIIMALYAHILAPQRAGFLFGFATLSGCLLLACGVVLGGMHQEQFQTFSTSLTALKGLTHSPEPLFWHFSLTEIAFLMAGVSSLFLLPCVPAHLWLKEILKGPGLRSALILMGNSSLIGVYFWLTWVLPVFPDEFARFSPWFIGWLGLSALYQSGLAWTGTNMGRWFGAATGVNACIALLGALLLSPSSANAAVLHAFAWAIVSIGIINSLEWMERHTLARRSQDIGYLFGQSPRLSILVSLFLLIAMATPLSAGFASLWTILLGVYTYEPLLGVLIVFAWGLYVCSLVALSIPFYLGSTPENDDGSVRSDLGKTALLAGLVLIALSIALGCHPRRFQTPLPEIKSFLTQTGSEGTRKCTGT